MPTWVIAVELGTKLVLLLLVGLSVWSVAIMFDRAKALSGLERPGDSDEARKLIQARNWDALAKWSRGGEGKAAFITQGVIQAALATGSRRPEQIERAVKSYLTDRRTELEQGLTVLATLGSNAPFIGLFGTVLGIIQAFAVLATPASGAAGSSSVMSGISEALIATAVGLFVAIPAVVAYNVFSRRLKKVLVQGESLRDYYLSYLD